MSVSQNHTSQVGQSSNWTIICKKLSSGFITSHFACISPPLQVNFYSVSLYPEVHALMAASKVSTTHAVEELWFPDDLQSLYSSLSIICYSRNLCDKPELWPCMHLLLRVQNFQSKEVEIRCTQGSCQHLSSVIRDRPVIKPPQNNEMIVHSMEGAPSLDCPPQPKERKSWALREALTCRRFLLILLINDIVQRHSNQNIFVQMNYNIGATIYTLYTLCLRASSSRDQFFGVLC